MESKKCIECGKKIKILNHNLSPKSPSKSHPRAKKYADWRLKVQKYCSKKCSTQAIVNERYSLLDHVKFFRSTRMVYTDWAVVPKEWYPKGIRRKAQGVKWTLKEIKEFKEWNQKNV